MHESPEGRWRKSSFSNANGCVEVAISPDKILVRNSRHQEGPTLDFTIGEWRAFIAGARLGEFDVPE
jgi:hypothetical protein